MSVLIVGVSHRSAPVTVLERVVPAGDDVDKLLRDAATSTHVREAVLLATCNRVEIYADVERFHGGVEGLVELLARYSGTSLTGLIPHLYVRYDEAAVSHLFGVACGLDSMVVGEDQILGQVKQALRLAQDNETIGSHLNALFQQALRVGKRAHTQTDISSAGQSVVSVALDRVRELRGRDDWSDTTVLIIGAGSMAALAGTAINRDIGPGGEGAADLVVTNRTRERSERLAGSLGARVVDLADFPDALAEADVVISCTGAVGAVVSTELTSAAVAARPDRPLVVVDLAMPRDVEPGVAELAGVDVVDLATLADALRDRSHGQGVDEVCQIVAEEVDQFVAATKQAAVTPTVVALRTRAAEVVDDELRRLGQRAPSLSSDERAEVEKTVRRVVDKLLHTPTIRVKELAEQTVETSYADALRKLFALDPATVDQVTHPDLGALGGEGGPR